MSSLLILNLYLYLKNLYFRHFYVSQLFSADAHERMKKSLQNVGYFSRISIISEIFPYCPTAQTVEFMFSNVAYRVTVYRTGALAQKMEMEVTELHTLDN